VKVISHRFAGSKEYWINRYAEGGRSGAGSYGEWAEFKACFLNGFVSSHRVETVIEYGCGDGNQLRSARYPSYLGFDVSSAAVAMCREIFRDDETKRFELLENYAGEEADLSLSLDVIYHLVEDDVFSAHMERLFSSARRFVIIYSSDTDEQERIQLPHVRHRKFTRWTDESLDGWERIRDLPGRHPPRQAGKEECGPHFTVYRRR
jgi:SAM-dependent methyltransferase